MLPWTESAHFVKANCSIGRRDFARYGRYLNSRGASRLTTLLSLRSMRRCSSLGMVPQVSTQHSRSRCHQLVN
ncbi:hypothetical protein J6590_066946 [Homalodisca vitripennis]|nr:hypothetical protein J6590_066946 [Homalodisca vitripennis]